MSQTAADTQNAIDPASKSMDEIVALAKRRGFVYPASEIYGGINGFWDYGPLGTQLKNNIRDHWWKHLVECPPLGPPEVSDGEPLSIVGLDSAIIQNPKTWEASGHVGGFSDPMVDDRETKQRFRADHAVGVWLAEHARDMPAEVAAEGVVERINKEIPDITVLDADARSMFDDLAKQVGWRKNKVEIVRFEELRDENRALVYQITVSGAKSFIVYFADLDQDFLKAKYSEVPSPFTGKRGTLTEPRLFNLMFETWVGAVQDEDSKSYLRPETAQGIFLNYKNVLDTMRVKVPFGVAQIGKAFRNEVTPRNFIFRSREFEQMEMEWFCHPDEAPQWYAFWKDERMKWWESLGIAPGNLRFRDHEEDELAHYSKMCVDVEYKYPFTAPGYGELEGIAHRGCFDLSQHQEHSGQKLEYLDQARDNERYIPNVIEPASGLTRAVLVLLCEAFTPTPDRSGTKFMLSFKPRFAPIKAGIFPLVNKDGMPEVAQKLYMDLREKFTCQYDVKQSIGKRYARMDEAGTPYCFTIDGDTLQDHTVTVRERDTQAQQRIAIGKVATYLAEHIDT